jgi:5-methylcytosine-specific restriction endonuclease McrA
MADSILNFGRNPRKPNTDRSGIPWSPQQMIAVWAKATPIAGYDERIWKRDICGRSMKFDQHGNRQSETGWEIDHINPVSNGGGDEINNLQPLNWNNNAAKGDKLGWRCGQ